jgi:raffinose/stachyose/melibiose transport system permease protein
MRLRGQSALRAIYFAPYVISEVVTGVIWLLMLQPDGLVDSAMRSAGMDGLVHLWLADRGVVLYTLFVVITWKYLGFGILLFLAGLQGIPAELYEAAAIDGASYRQTVRHVVVPLLGPTIRIWAFLSIIGALQLFDLVYIIWGQYVSSTAGTSTMATYMVTEGRNAGNYGYGNAVAVVLFLISMVIALVYQRFVLRRDTQGALGGR